MSGDFRKFYDSHFAKIFRFVLIRVGDRDLAEDLASEIFLKAFRAFASYDEKVSKSSWIFTIARNHLINHYRTLGRFVTDEELEDLPLAGENFSELAARRYDVRQMLDCLAELPAEKQSLIRMKHLEELSYEEMAERLGREKGALKVAAFRAMAELRKAMRAKKYDLPN